jgi:hypothetical protein
MTLVRYSVGAFICIEITLDGPQVPRARTHARA